MFQEGGKRINNPFAVVVDKILFTIITVVYNGEKYLTQTIQSVVSQLNDTIEYIIIDGGSKDRTLDIIKSYDNKSIIGLANPTLVSATHSIGNKIITRRNFGIINSDDWYEPDHLKD
jgi:glycosyltransferase involved in cell wall biosynthesis